MCSFFGVCVAMHFASVIRWRVCQKKDSPDMVKTQSTNKTVVIDEVVSVGTDVIVLKEDTKRSKFQFVIKTIL